MLRSLNAGGESNGGAVSHTRSGVSPRNNNSMHTTSFSNHHNTGLGPSNNAYLHMMQAKMEREQKKLQMMRVEARLRKLQSDEEKTAKRISDAKKQQEFVTNMKNEKDKDLNMKLNHQQKQKETESFSRSRF